MQYCEHYHYIIITVLCARLQTRVLRPRSVSRGRQSDVVTTTTDRSPSRTSRPISSVYSAGAEIGGARQRMKSPARIKASVAGQSKRAVAPRTPPSTPPRQGRASLRQGTRPTTPPWQTVSQTTPPRLSARQATPPRLSTRQATPTRFSARHAEKSVRSSASLVAMTNIEHWTLFRLLLLLVLSIILSVSPLCCSSWCQ